MKLALLVLALIAVKTTQAAIAWDDLRVHWSPLGAIGGFHELPRTAAEAVSGGQVTPPEAVGVDDDIDVFCPADDPTICTLYDKMGSIAGLQISVLRSDVDDIVPYPIEQHPSYVATSRFGHQVYLTTLFFVTQEVLAAGGRPSLDQDGTGTGLWLQNGPTRDTLFEVPRLQSDMAQTDYTLENCVPGMGVHYYYNISEAMLCEDFFPIFVLYDADNTEMVGLGFQLNGRATQLGARKWFENVPASAIKRVVPNSPQCLTDWTDIYGVVSLHIYFTDKPWAIKCTSE